MQFNQVKALVTGGASGLGLSVARHIIAHGGSVALLDINDKAGPAVAKELGGRACYIHTDGTSESAVVRAVAEAVEANSGLNLAVNCAGVLGADRPLLLELIDRDGVRLAAQRNEIWVRPNETRGCVGCHESRVLAPENRVPMAIRRQPVAIGVGSDEAGD